MHEAIRENTPGMRTALVVAACLAAATLVSTMHYTAAMKSRFAKDYDEQKLTKDWEDAEDEDWHEDTYEWKKKTPKKVAFDPKDPNAFMKASAASSGLSMSFCTLYAGHSKEETEELGKRWQGLLQTNGVTSKIYAIGEDNLLVTDDDGNIFEIKEFLLNQPEVEKFRYKDTDFYPPGKQPTSPPDPMKEAERLKKKAKKNAKSKSSKPKTAKKSKDKKAKKEKEDTEL